MPLFQYTLLTTKLTFLDLSQKMPYPPQHPS